QFRRSLVIT
ncbi:tRNA synthetases class I family protein, partial [Vibrio parahaemolyticus V-223/04]